MGSNGIQDEPTAKIQGKNVAVYKIFRYFQRELAGKIEGDIDWARRYKNKKATLSEGRSGLWLTRAGLLHSVKFLAIKVFRQEKLKKFCRY